jgi:hypothetical protein
VVPWAFLVPVAVSPLAAVAAVVWLESAAGRHERLGERLRAGSA